MGRQTVATSGRWNLFSLLVLEEKRDTNKHQHTVRIPPHPRPISPKVFLNLTANLTFIYGFQCQEDIKIPPYPNLISVALKRKKNYWKYYFYTVVICIEWVKSNTSYIKNSFPNYSTILNYKEAIKYNFKNVNYSGMWAHEHEVAIIECLGCNCGDSHSIYMERMSWLHCFYQADKGRLINLNNLKKAILTLERSPKAIKIQKTKNKI